jgi:hypothetical protein
VDPNSPEALAARQAAEAAEAAEAQADDDIETGDDMTQKTVVTPKLPRIGGGDKKKKKNTGLFGSKGAKGKKFKIKTTAVRLPKPPEE